MRGRLLALPALAAAILLSILPNANAGIFLKPNGRDAMALWMRSISADAKIEGQFADTAITMVFQNENDKRMEADFIYQLPPGAVATYFAYWAGDEKVVARVVEKETAAAIYSHITSQNRDPALIEMLGNNTFRARIFPVFPNRDLKVEVRIAQVLPSSAEGVVYTLPLLAAEAPDPMDSVDIRIRIKAGEEVEKVINNYGLPVEFVDGYHQLVLYGENFRPEKDLNVRMVRFPAPLITSLCALPSGDGTGFFVLALTPDHTVVNPRINIRGIRTYDVVLPTTGQVKAGESLVVFGRYRGSNVATASVTGQTPVGYLSYSAKAAFPRYSQTDCPAPELWAAARIAQLSLNDRNRSTVIALSKQFGIPSKYTSWLAVPEEEMISYNLDKYQGQINAAVSSLAKLIIQGQERSQKAAALRKTLNALSKKVGRSLDESLQYELSNAVYQLASDLVEERHKAKPDKKRLLHLENRIKHVAALAGLSADNCIQDAENSYSQILPFTVSKQLAKLIAEGKGETPEAEKLHNELNAACEKDNTDPKDRLRSVLYSEMYQEWRQLMELVEAGKDTTSEGLKLQDRLKRLTESVNIDYDKQLQDNVRNHIGNLAFELVNLRQDPKTKPETIAAVEAKIRRLEKRYGISAEPYIKDREMYLKTGEYWELESRLGDLIVQGKAGTAQFKAIRERYTSMAKELNRNPEEDLKDRFESLLRELVSCMVEEDYKPKPDPAVVSSLKQQITRVESASGLSSDDMVQSCEQQWASYEIFNTAGQLNAELQREKPNSERLKRLKERVHSLAVKLPESNERYEFARDYSSAVDEAVKIRLEMLTVASEMREARRRGEASKTSQLQRQYAQLKANFDKQYENLYYAARWGDPLISVEAPRDALHVIAIMPGGEIKTLTYNEDTNRWEARFDIPAYAPEGEYLVQIIIVLKDGSRKTLTLRYHVDMTSPNGKIAAGITDDGKRLLTLSVDADKDTSRAAVILPWGDRVEMRSSGQPNRFYTVVEVPDHYLNETAEIKFILTDSAHNRTNLLLETKVR